MVCTICVLCYVLCPITLHIHLLFTFIDPSSPPHHSLDYYQTQQMSVSVFVLTFSLFVYVGLPEEHILQETLFCRNNDENQSNEYVRSFVHYLQDMMYNQMLDDPIYSLYMYQQHTILHQRSINHHDNQCHHYNPISSPSINQLINHNRMVQCMSQ
jgi:hypothetical protein